MQGSTQAKSLRQRQTDAEQLLWYRLRDRRLSGYKFRRQLPIGTYIADYVCMSSRLLIEIDGGQHAANAAYDEQRTDFLRQEGYKVIRFWNNDVLQNLEGVLTTILAELKKREAPSP
jgi:very-short-patch-repair endonuclease